MWPCRSHRTQEGEDSDAPCDWLPQTSGRDHLASVVMIFVAGEEVEGSLKLVEDVQGYRASWQTILPATRARLQL